ncbi:unnamed protein product [Taenia asiatica]|uniref:COS domain-containing protein n=1 Tax=Taenia asiatica TaxID=60517 RepID=A0A0R3VXU4_TAEAS|nr:unnamed protein product [Taenia asiatica]
MLHIAFSRAHLSAILSYMQHVSTLLAKLSSLSRHKVTLNSHLEKLNKQNNSELLKKENSWVVILGALEIAMCELHAAADKALNAASAKVEVVCAADFEVIDGLVHRIANLFNKTGKIHSVYASLEELKDLQGAVVIQKSLERLLFDAATLKEAMEQLPSLSITQMHLSEQFKDIDLRVRDFNLVLCDRVVLPPQQLQLHSCIDFGDKK